VSRTERLPEIAYSNGALVKQQTRRAEVPGMAGP
jgi:hypothetical protein